MYKAKIFCGDNFWMVAYVEPDLCKYLRTLYHGYTSNVNKIQKPIWSSHISILRKEEPLDKELYMSYQDKIINFHLVKQPATNGFHIWYPVISPEICKIRTSLGLNIFSYCSLHLTIGNII